MKYYGVVLVGPPCVGKGTLARNLVENTPTYPLETGKLVRAEIKQETELGQRIQPYVAKGELVPDEDISSLVLDTIMGSVRGGSYEPAEQILVLDGFPRTLPQVDYLLSQVKVIEVYHCTKTDDAEIRNRLEQRIKNSERRGVVREDDTPKTLTRRLKAYKRWTKPVIKELKKHGIWIHEIDMRKRSAQVYNEVLDHFNNETMARFVDSRNSA